MIPRWVHRLWAFVGGYFWLPCPQCGKYFGGHQVRGAAYMGTYVIRVEAPPAQRIACPECTWSAEWRVGTMRMREEAAVRVWREFLNREAT